jgi:hypothetical protein
MATRFKSLKVESMSNSDEEIEALRTWVRNWQVVGPELERFRREELRRCNTQESIRSFDLAFKATLRNTPARENSGLVEFQRLLQELPR